MRSVKGCECRCISLFGLGTELVKQGQSAHGIPAFPVRAICQQRTSCKRALQPAAMLSHPHASTNQSKSRVRRRASCSTFSGCRSACMSYAPSKDGMAHMRSLRGISLPSQTRRTSCAAARSRAPPGRPRAGSARPPQGLGRLQRSPRRAPASAQSELLQHREHMCGTPSMEDLGFMQAPAARAGGACQDILGSVIVTALQGASVRDGSNTGPAGRGRGPGIDVGATKQPGECLLLYTLDDELHGSSPPRRHADSPPQQRSRRLHQSRRRRRPLCLGWQRWQLPNGAAAR